MSIKTDTIFTIENRSVGSRGYILDEAGIRASMNPAIIPDLMVRRIQVLLFGRDTVNRTFVKIDKSWTREGFLFDKINPNNIWDQRARQQPDINWGDDEPHFKRTLYLPEGLTKIDVEKIQDYAVNRSVSLIEKGITVTWPPIGKYPNWNTPPLRRPPVYKPKL